MYVTELGKNGISVFHTSVELEWDIVFMASSSKIMQITEISLPVAECTTAAHDYVMDAKNTI